MEVWGGLECTINRVGDEYFDQLEYAGHYSREKDIAHFSELGIKKLRYPILWEKHQPTSKSEINWEHVESNLLFLREKRIEPIAGLVHHGSGPAFVNILEDTFAKGLAAYAEQVAMKFPWINFYTPINEPLTTARFCGLYKLWHPHKNDDYSFLKILMNECKATILAMKAIRKINPDAQLLQTEDLGKTHSSSKLQYQAYIENHRRWLGFDLLCGRVIPEHPLYNYILQNGIKPEELIFFRENTCVPDMIGFNHYITSERYIDENLADYPIHTHGGNGKDTYADVEAVRVKDCELSGPYQLIKEGWEKFNIPVALTEVHLHCSREEQLRWFYMIWDVALQLEKDGIPIQGVTAWALLGSFGWNKLLTTSNGDYEAGLFDISSGNPRPTALSKMIKHYAQGLSFEHPVICREGWWKQDSRILYPLKLSMLNQSAAVCSPILIIGQRGTLGSAFARICKQRNIHYEVLNSNQLDVINARQIEQYIIEKMPWAIINTAGFVRVDDAESASDECFLINTNGPRNLALACEKYGVKLMTFSTDLVFDGEKKAAYMENDIVNPLNVYGKSKVKAEECVLEINPDALIIRTSTFFGPWDNYNFVSHILDKTQNRISYKAPEDVFISPTYVPDLVNVSLDLLIDDEKGLWHLTNNGTTNWSDLAIEVAERGGCERKLINVVLADEMDFKAVRPKFSALKSNAGALLPSLENALSRCFENSEFITV